MSITSHEQVHVKVSRRDDGIYVLNTLNNSTEGVDEWMKHIEDIYVQHEQTDEPILVLADLGQSPPLTYTMESAQEVLKRHPNLPRGCRTAFLTDDKATSFFGVLPKLSRVDVAVNFFSPKQQDEALAWLKATE